MEKKQLQPGLIGHWDFSRVKGSIVPDQSSGRNDGRISGTGKYACRMDKEGRRNFLSFPPGKELPGLLRAQPDKSMVLVNCSANLYFSSGLTFNARFACNYGEFLPSTSAFACLFSVGPAYNSGLSIMVGRAGGLLVYLKSQANNPQKDSHLIPAKIMSRQETVLTVTDDGEFLRIYLNGKPEADPVRHDPVFLFGKHPLQIGYADGCPFCGRIFEVKLYNRPLAEPEIQAVSGKVEPAAAKVFNDTEPVRECVGKPNVYQHVETWKMPQVSQPSKDRGYVLFNWNHMDLSFPDTIPEKDSGRIALKCFVPAGEYQPVSFCVRALKDLSGLSVELEKTGNGKMFLPESAVDIREVMMLNRRINFCAQEYMLAPTYLEPIAAKPLDRNTTRQFWLNIRLPENSRPGFYRGNLLVKTQNDGTEKIPLEVEVLSFKLVEAEGMQLGMFFMPPQQSPNYLKAFMDMRQHGMTSVGWCGDSGLKFSHKNGQTIVDFRGSIMEKIFQAYVRVGFPGRIFWAMHGDESAFCNQFLLDEWKFRRVYVSVIKQIIAYAKKIGMPGIIFQPYDESPSNPMCFPALVRELKCIKEAGGTTENDHLPLKSIRAGIQPWADQCVPDTDIFTLRYSSKPIWYVDEWPKLEKELKKRGKVLFSYNINNASTFPELATLRFCGGWFFRSAAKETSGQYLWLYGMGDNPYDDLESDYAKFVQFFPPEKTTGRKGGPAILWESYREGVNDLRYIMTLEKQIRKAGNSSKEAREAQKLLDKLSGSFDLEKARRKCIYFESRWDKTRPAKNGRVVVQGKFNVPNGWLLEDYDRARRLIADAIIKLQGVKK